MLTTVNAGSLTVRGVSVGGVYTSLFIPELSSVFDIGIASRSAAAADFLFLSHGHVDHVGALSSFLGIRALTGKKRPPTVFLPKEIDTPLKTALDAMAVLQRYDLDINSVPMEAGDAVNMRGDMEVRAHANQHRVPCLSYSLVRKIKKLKNEHLGLSGQEIAKRKHAGDDLFRVEERCELSYCTDTLIEALDETPELYSSRVLVLECTFLDERKSRDASRAGCHVHLDEILQRADRFQNEAIVLMHFSQLYKPSEITAILDDRCPAKLRSRIIPFLPKENRWPG